eukprot:CAMPEP_0170624482 /NCGR_PEP_ID=MMETSP0224-20130122/30254_1 /TAXON_ID=285029 /ORGANISM="Togula jolla, Strain CCCM 725" /LENGTH=98 /DNA_ID=CAMNT_0010951003 /DNA_START=21 /DNA_END=317 /DNA_ORIENTATION=+
MPSLLLPMGAVQSRRNYVERMAEEEQDTCDQSCSDTSQTLENLGGETCRHLQASQAPRANSKRMSVTFGEVDIVCYSSEESEEMDDYDMDGCDSDEMA